MVKASGSEPDLDKTRIDLSDWAFPMKPKALKTWKHLARSSIPLWVCGRKMPLMK